MSNRILPDEKPNLPVPTKDCSGKTVIVTGANVGIGKEAATLFARLGAAHVILASRSVEGCDEAVAQAKAAAKDPNAKVECWQLDLSKFKSVQAFVEKAKSLPRLDVLLNNAGVANPARIETEDGFETMLQVNGISTAYVSAQLLPLLESTAKQYPDSNFKPHLTLVTSGNILGATQEAFVAAPGKGLIQTWNDAGTDRSEDEMNMQWRYGWQTKGLNALNVMTLSEQATSSVIVNCVCPGLVRTTLSRNAPPAFKEHLKQLWEKIGLDPEEGARNPVWASTELTPPGAFSQNCAVTENPVGFVFSPEGRALAPGIWKEYEQIWKEKGML